MRELALLCVRVEVCVSEALLHRQQVRACGNRGVANEKSVPAKGVGAGGEVRCVAADGSCVPARTHGVGVAWEGARVGDVCGRLA